MTEKKNQYYQKAVSPDPDPHSESRGAVTREETGMYKQQGCDRCAGAGVGQQLCRCQG